MTSNAPNPAAERANVFPWPPVLFVGAIVAAWGLDYAAPFTWPGADDGPARVIGIGFGIAGFGLVGWAIATLRRHGTTVMADQKSTALVTDGPYRRFRNPIYLGEALILLSAAELTKNIWFVAAAFAFAALVTQLQIMAEERHLEAQFGDAYLAYKSQSRRWI